MELNQKGLVRLLEFCKGETQPLEQSQSVTLKEFPCNSFQPLLTIPSEGDLGRVVSQSLPGEFAPLFSVVFAPHSSSSLMFWTNWNEQHPSIMRASLSGANMITIIDKDIRTPNGLAIDHKAEKIYFSDATLDKIERCEYDGSQRQVRPIVRNVSSQESLGRGRSHY